MPTLTRWEPYREMRRVHDMLDRAMEEGLIGNLASDGLSLYEGLAPVDVYQTDDAIVVKAALPGVRPDDIDISVTGDTLTIRGEVKEEATNGNDDARQYHVRERRYSRFARSLTLPSMVNANKAEAEIEDGIVTLTIPKAEEAKPRQITVKTKK
jgi:HSP20 family protein